MTLASTVALLAAFAAAALGEGDHTDVGTTTSGFYTHVLETQPGSTAPALSGGSNVDPIVSTLTEAVCAVGGAQTCAQAAVCDDGNAMTSTIYVTESGTLIDGGDNCPNELGEPIEPEVTPGLVLQAFRRIPLPESELTVQPPGGRTLVNFDTNFYTEAGEFTRTITLLGRRVELRIWPASFGWRFGDGETRQTTEPGDAYPNLEVTHRYLRKGSVSPSVDTTYAAQFRVGDGPWRDVNGTVTIPGSPEVLRVVTARPVLVGYS